MNAETLGVQKRSLDAMVLGVTGGCEWPDVGAGGHFLMKTPSKYDKISRPFKNQTN